MALTRDQLGDLRDDRVRPLALPGAADRPGPPGRRPTFGDWARQTGAVSDRWRQRLSEAWVVVFTGAVMLEPAAADPQAAEPLWAVGLFLALAAALVAMSVGLARGRRVGLLAGVAAAGLALVGAVMCPVSSHHTAIGAWWYLQMAGFAGLMAATVVALRHSRSTARP